MKTVTLISALALVLPLAANAAPKTINNLEAVTYKASAGDKCNAEFLNNKYATKVLAKKYLELPYYGKTQTYTLRTVAMNEMPVSCNGDNKIAYVGSPLLGGLWVDVQDLGQANAKWNKHLKMFGQDKWTFRVLGTK